MRKSTETLYLTLTLFLGSVSLSASDNFQRSVAAFKSEDYAISLRGLKSPAEHGLPLAQLFLGVAHSGGWGFLEDDKIAVWCYRLTAEQGDARSQSNLGVIYANEEGVKQNNVYADM